MTSILTLRPNVTFRDARRQFLSRDLRGVVSALTKGPLQTLTDVYLPYRLYRVNVRNGRAHQTHLFAVDSLRGELDLYHLPDSASDELISINTRNHPLATLPEAQAKAMLITKVERWLFLQGFFRIQNLQLSADFLSDFHIPYWVGFFGRDGRLRLGAIDAVRRTHEGSKVVDLLSSWLSQDSTITSMPNLTIESTANPVLR